MPEKLRPVPDDEAIEALASRQELPEEVSSLLAS
jgi:hypothetical protein